MANRFYGLGLHDFAEGLISFSSDTQKAALVSSASYTPNFTTDHYLSVIPGGAIIAAGVALTSKTNVLGTLGAANTIWTSVSGSQAAFIILYKDSGTSSTSPLWGYIDTATGLPVTPNGGDITAAWASGNICTLFQGLEGRKEPGLVRRLEEWMREVLGIEATRSPEGLWIPSPALSLGGAR
jgi:hypothetical protein